MKYFIPNFYINVKVTLIQIEFLDPKLYTHGYSFEQDKFC